MNPVPGGLRMTNSQQSVGCKIWRRHPDLNRRIKVLQTSALPLGYAAKHILNGAENGIRTRDPRLGKAMLYH